MDEISERYRRVYEQLKKQVSSIEEELENLEESGDADRYPVKHQKARDKIEEINRQIKSLEDAFGDKKEEEEPE